jgi:hypothetical protein
MLTRLGSLIDHTAHLVTRERPHRLRADVSRRAERQQSGGRRLIVRGFHNPNDVVLPKGPIDIYELNTEVFELLLGGFVAINRVLEAAMPCSVQLIRVTYLGIAPSPLVAIGLG